MYSVQILKMKLCSVPIQYWIKSWGKAGWRCLHSVCFDDSFYTEKLPDMHHFHLLGNAVSVNWNCFWSRVGVFNLQANGGHMVIILMLMPKPKSSCLKKKKKLNQKKRSCVAKICVHLEYNERDVEDHKVDVMKQEKLTFIFSKWSKPESIALEYLNISNALSTVIQKKKKKSCKGNLGSWETGAHSGLEGIHGFYITSVLPTILKMKIRYLSDIWFQRISEAFLLHYFLKRWSC